MYLFRNNLWMRHTHQRPSRTSLSESSESMFRRKTSMTATMLGWWLSVSADEVRYVSNKEQLEITIRFVDKEDNIREEFLTFLDVSESTTGEHLSAQILKLLPSLGLFLDKCRSQCYEGAGNTAGKVSGVGARISRLYPQGSPFLVCCPSAQQMHCPVVQHPLHKENDGNSRLCCEIIRILTKEAVCSRGNHWESCGGWNQVDGSRWGELVVQRHNQRYSSHICKGT